MIVEIIAAAVAATFVIDRWAEKDREKEREVDLEKWDARKNENHQW